MTCNKCDNFDSAEIIDGVYMCHCLKLKGYYTPKFTCVDDTSVVKED